MIAPRLAFALVGAALAASQPSAPLRVLRATPSGDVPPTVEIAVTFDRPVAGSLDRSVDPSGILRIDPAVPGRAEWRDPVTLRFVPSRALEGGTRYTVTVSNAFTAMDGSALAEPHVFSFRVHGPRLLSGVPVGPPPPDPSQREQLLPRNLEPSQPLDVVWSAPVNSSKLESAAFIELGRLCGGARTVRVRVAGQRRLTNDDHWRYHSVRRSGRGATAADSLRRVVQLVPVTPLPTACRAALVLPSEIADDISPELERWPFETYGPLRLLSAGCGWGNQCPTGPLSVAFTTPVRGSEVAKHLKILPATPFTVRDTATTNTNWVLEAELRPRVAYAVVADTLLRDVFGQRIAGNPAVAYRTPGYQPTVTYPFGRLLVERRSLGTLAVQHVNVDTLVVQIATVPDSLEARALSQSGWSWRELWSVVGPRATERRIALPPAIDRSRITPVKLPVPGRGAPTLMAVRVMSAADARALRNPELSRDASGNGREAIPVALVQVTDIGVHAKVGVEEGAVWVTGVADGRPLSGAAVELHDTRGRVIARATSDAQGLARLGSYRSATASDGGEETPSYGFEGYVAVKSGDDRALAMISEYDPDLSSWSFDAPAAWGNEREPAAGAVFTERGIYRPGETVYAKAIVRTGPLGALAVPAAGDSVRWRVRDSEGTIVSDTVVRLSRYGTTTRVVQVASTAAIGTYAVAAELWRGGDWAELASDRYRVAEYRPAEFAVDLTAAEGPYSPGDSLRANVQARYLFGAPMGRAAVSWQARQAPTSPSSLEIPGTEGWFLGEHGWSPEEDNRGPGVEVFASGSDTLDAAGALTLGVELPRPRRGFASRVTVQAVVTDVNRQTVGAATGSIVHPASFYIAARMEGSEWFWTAGTPQRVSAVAVRPDGRRVPGVRITGSVVRREWHQVRREREGMVQLVGEWVSDTIARCSMTSAAEPAPCSFTPREGGSYVVAFGATDTEGRIASTSFNRWATGDDWVPWSDETQFRMDVVADRERYSVGDTATVLFASPFTDADAWLTVEREGLIEQRQIRLKSGSTTLRFPITEDYAPNAFVSILVARGRSASPGPLDDPGRPTIRVGYTELRVTPEVKRLALTVTPGRAEYRPGDTATVAINVRDAAGRGQTAEVALWAVDEGVLALTGYTTPDPLDLLYRPRGVGMRLASNLTTVAAQVPEGEKGTRAPGGGGGAGDAEILRSDFKTTAFFLGSVETDSRGNATASAKLPDNLTTFRVMAVAVTAGDRYGKGESPLLVTRPLIARPALPRFVRPGDRFTAGAIVNQRAGGTPTVEVRASVSGASLEGAATQRAKLEAGRGRDVRFPFRVARGADTAVFRFDVSGAGDADAVERRIPLRPDHTPRAHTVAGVARGSEAVTLTLPSDIDPARSTVQIGAGLSPLDFVRGAAGAMRVYPYWCTEQLASGARPILALYRGRLAGLVPDEGRAAAAASLAQIQTAVTLISRRQRDDGGIGFWGRTDWTSPWLSSYAGMFLLDARSAGAIVDDSVLVRLEGYLGRSLKSPIVVQVARPAMDPGSELRERVAAADYLSRMGRADVAAENELLRQAMQMRLEDRVRLAEILARRNVKAAARTLLQPIWAATIIEGRRAVIRDSLMDDGYFHSSRRPYARLLTATLAVDSAHALIGPLAETLVQSARGDAARRWQWNTQDYGSTVSALAELARRQGAAGPSNVRISFGGAEVMRTTSATPDSLTRRSLTGLLAGASADPKVLSLTIEGDSGRPVYYHVTVREVPLVPPVTPDESGIRVERWYESLTGAPAVSAVEGALVRVRLRVTVPAERQFVVLDDALPAGLEAVDLSLRTAAVLPGPGAGQVQDMDSEMIGEGSQEWGYGRWDAGWWTPFEHREIRDDRVVYAARVLWAGTYTASYIARATTPGVFVRPPAHAEEMYNPSVRGRSDGGVFTVTAKAP